MKLTIEGADLVQRQLERLAEHSSRTVRDGLARLAFAVRQALVAEVAGAQLHWSSPSTQRFMSQSWRIRYRTTAGVFTAEVFPLPTGAAFIARHAGPYTNLPGKQEDLEIRGKIAIPIQSVIQRGRSGRVPKRLMPVEILKRNAKGQTQAFINAAGTAIMYRRRDADPVPAYALVQRTAQPRRLHLDRAAAAAVSREAAPAFAAAIAKAERAAAIR